MEAAKYVWEELNKVRNDKDSVFETLKELGKMFEKGFDNREEL